MFNLTIEYLELLNNRMEFFEGKVISDLNIDEVKEYLNLLQEWNEVIGKMSKDTEDAISVLAKAFGELADQISKNFKKLFVRSEILEAEELYKKRVLERGHDHENV